MQGLGPKLLELAKLHEMRIERLESHMRAILEDHMELSKDYGVLNRKVDTLHDELQAISFLEEEIPSQSET